MLTATYILASILQVAQPGYSDLSRVYLPIEQCSEQCSVEFLRVRGHSPTLDYRGKGFAKRAVWQGWTVRETRLEGLTRFVTIARAMATVINGLGLARKHARRLSHVMVTIARHESAFWRSIHDGTLRGAAGEKGIFQIHPSLPEFKDCQAGVDLESTMSCTRVAAELLLRVERLCGTLPGTIAAYGSGQGCQPTGSWVDGVRDRLKTYDRTHRRTALRFDVRLAIEMTRP